MLLPRISRRSSHPGPALAVVRAAVVILVFVLSIVAVVLPIVVPVLLLPIVLKLLDSLKHIRRAVERDFYPSFFWGNRPAKKLQVSSCEDSKYVGCGSPTFKSARRLRSFTVACVKSEALCFAKIPSAWQSLAKQSSPENKKQAGWTPANPKDKAAFPRSDKQSRSRRYLRVSPMRASEFQFLRLVVFGVVKNLLQQHLHCAYHLFRRLNGRNSTAALDARYKSNARTA